MTIAPAIWLRNHVAVYVRNAGAVRDYRVQLRGNRAVILWAVYLFVLIGFGMMQYTSAARQGQMSVVDAQASLQNFYQSIIYLLATSVMLIAPALTATSVVAERQRKSLDLVFSAPVSPKYYLVGKIISSYRYIWMLLVLSLPITAACVVLGGASWSEVLISYALISIHGLIYTAIALLFSTLAQKPVGAIVWSYIGVWTYVGFMSYLWLGLLSSFRHVAMFGMPGAAGASINEMPFVVGLSPYSVLEAAPSYTVIGSYHVPNLVLAVLATFLIVKLLLVAAGSALSPYGSAETISLRLHGLVYAFLLSFGLTVAIGPSIPATSSSFAPSSTAGSSPPVSIVPPDTYFGRILIALVAVIGILLPVLSCYGTDLEKKFWPDGLFSVRKMLIATPAGGLPYIFSIVLALALGVVAFSFQSTWSPGIGFVAYLFYALALVFFCWSIGRMASAVNNGLRYARTLHFSILMLLLVVPLPFLMITDPFGYGPNDPSVWDLYIMRPLFSTSDRTGMAFLWGTVLLVGGLLLMKGSEGVAERKYSQVGLTYGRT